MPCAMTIVPPLAVANAGELKTDLVGSHLSPEKTAESSGFTDDSGDERSTPGVYRSGQTGQTVNLTEDSTSHAKHNTSKATPKNSSPNSPAISEKQPEMDADLRAVFTAWPNLPADVRKMIRGVVKATVEAAATKR